MEVRGEQENISNNVNLTTTVAEWKLLRHKCNCKALERAIITEQSTTPPIQGKAVHHVSHFTQSPEISLLLSLQHRVTILS